MKFKEKFYGVIPNSKVRRHNRHFYAATTKKVERLHCFLVFGSIKLTFGVRGNFGLLISNLNSKMQYRFEILRKMQLFFSFSSVIIFSPERLKELVTMETKK